MVSILSPYLFQTSINTITDAKTNHVLTLINQYNSLLVRNLRFSSFLGDLTSRKGEILINDLKYEEWGKVPSYLSSSKRKSKAIFFFNAVFSWKGSPFTAPVMNGREKTALDWERMKENKRRRIQGLPTVEEEAAQKKMELDKKRAEMINKISAFSFLVLSDYFLLLASENAKQRNSLFSTSSTSVPIDDASRNLESRLFSNDSRQSQPPKERRTAFSSYKPISVQQAEKPASHLPFINSLVLQEREKRRLGKLKELVREPPSSKWLSSRDLRKTKTGDSVSADRKRKWDVMSDGDSVSADDVPEKLRKLTMSPIPTMPSSKKPALQRRNSLNTPITLSYSEEEEDLEDDEEVVEKKEKVSMISKVSDQPLDSRRPLDSQSTRFLNAMRLNK